MLCLAAIGTVVGQTYQIRVTYNSNLRASYSLDSAVITSARAGTTLEVVGQHNRWLRVQHEGREFWMASWVSHSRVDAQPTAVSADIDNCCFVDRQCQSDQEWTDGYWAYQNNQCAAPAHSTAAASERPLIEGSPAFVRGIAATLDLMELHASQWFQYVLGVTKHIAEHYESEYCTTAFAHVGTGKTSMGICMLYWRGRGSRLYRVSVAGILAHEACHHHGHDIDPLTGEFDHWPCQKAARDASAAILASTESITCTHGQLASSTC